MYIYVLNEVFPECLMRNRLRVYSIYCLTAKHILQMTIVTSFESLNYPYKLLR